jgi:alanine-glyoxylate transaminase/serine-glyoxylate transaminase/serine-pyruvate transaminase
MEAAVGNLVEPGDTMLVPTNGYFGGRMQSMAERAGGEVVHVDAPWGEPLDPTDVEAAFDEHQPDVFGFVHAETSTGVKQPDVSALTDIAHAHDAYVIADCVTSLGGVEFRVDEWGIDVAYSGPQKCLSCPPGASPLTLNDRAMEKVLSRETEPRSWYLDLSLLEGYWGDERAYHHTAPITNVYALREALRLVAEEGIENRWERHLDVAGGLKSGLEALGLEMNAPDDYWLPSLNAVRVPSGVDDGAVIAHLLDEYDLEIASGLGDLAGEIWRIGCMGHSARPKNVEYVLSALEDALEREGYDTDQQASTVVSDD